MANNDGDRPLRVAVLGAGPVGLDAALAGLDAGYEVNVYDAGGRPSNNVRDWGHVRLFSPWSMNVSPRMRRHAARAGLPLDVDEEAFLTGHDLADRLLDPLWARACPKSSLHLGTCVVAVGRAGLLKHEEIGSPERGRRPFRILLRDAEGREWVESADVVLDCTGKYGNPNTLGDGGIPAPGEQLLGARIERRIPGPENQCKGVAGAHNPACRCGPLRADCGERPRGAGLRSAGHSSDLGPTETTAGLGSRTG